MEKNYLAIVLVICISVLLLLVYIKKAQIKDAFFALLVAQFFSWPLTLIFVYFKLQINPVRLFPHATDSSFLFAFIFHPSVFVVYYLNYPKNARFEKRLLYSVILPATAMFTQFFADLYTDLIYFPQKWTLIGLYFFIFIIYNIARKYIDWFFKKSFTALGE